MTLLILLLTPSRGWSSAVSTRFEPSIPDQASDQASDQALRRRTLPLGSSAFQRCPDVKVEAKGEVIGGADETGVPYGKVNRVLEGGIRSRGERFHQPVGLRWPCW